MAPEQAAPLFKQLLMALKALHSQEILHLDIKPDNIWIRESGQALLLDFGSSLQGLANAVSHHASLRPSRTHFTRFPHRSLN